MSHQLAERRREPLVVRDLVVRLRGDAQQASRVRGAGDHGHLDRVIAEQHVVERVELQRRDGGGAGTPGSGGTDSDAIAPIIASGQGSGTPSASATRRRPASASARFRSRSAGTSARQEPCEEAQRRGQRERGGRVVGAGPEELDAVAERGREAARSRRG